MDSYRKVCDTTGDLGSWGPGDRAAREMEQALHPIHSQLLKHNNPRPQRIQSRLVPYWQGQDIPEPFRYSSAEDSNSQPEVNARAGNLASTPATLYLLAHPASQAGGMGQEALLHVLSSGLWPQP